MVSAFFGLDDAMPLEGFRLCSGAPGRDGMPVTFSRRVTGPIDPGAFTAITRSGARRQPLCATLKPADESSENHTVLLIGELGSEPDDPPARVEMTGHLLLEGGVDAQGLSAPVTPLAEGPTIVLAFSYPAGAIDSDCPPGTRQLVEVVWAGGVRPGPGSTPETHRQGYQVKIDEQTVTPFALGDLDDRDNYVHLCLDTEIPAREVGFQENILIDPRGDVNPRTTLAITQARR
jgi:hypothetical protein